jgi:hypothetical protein
MRQASLCTINLHQNTEEVTKRLRSKSIGSEKGQ